MNRSNSKSDKRTLSQHRAILIELHDKTNGLSPHLLYPVIIRDAIIENPTKEALLINPQFFQYENECFLSDNFFYSSVF